jgi:hypothetical protein
MTIVQNLTSWLRGRRPPADPSRITVVTGAPLDDESPVVREMAERLRQRELAAGGWAAEAGGLPLESYLSEARRLVRQIALGGGQGGPPAP